MAGWFTVVAPLLPELIRVARPMFTRSREPSQIPQQIRELQDAVDHNDQAIKALASELEQTLAALKQASTEAERTLAGLRQSRCARKAAAASASRVDRRRHDGGTGVRRRRLRAGALTRLLRAAPVESGAC